MSVKVFEWDWWVSIALLMFGQTVFHAIAGKSEWAYTLSFGIACLILAALSWVICHLEWKR